MLWLRLYLCMCLDYFYYNTMFYSVMLQALTLLDLDCFFGFMSRFSVSNFFKWEVKRTWKQNRLSQHEYNYFEKLALYNHWGGLWLFLPKCLSLEEFTRIFVILLVQRTRKSNPMGKTTYQCGNVRHDDSICTYAYPLYKPWCFWQGGQGNSKQNGFAMRGSWLCNWK